MGRGKSIKSLAIVEAAVPASVSAEIRIEHEAACRAMRSGLEHARRAGALLNQAKAAVPHGQWLPWLAANCPDISLRVAQMYMRVAARWPELEARANTKRVSHLSIRDAVALLAEPSGAAPVAAVSDLECEAQAVECALAELRRKVETPAVDIHEAIATFHEAQVLEARAAALAGRAKLEYQLHLKWCDDNGYGWMRELVNDVKQHARFIRLCDQRISELTEVSEVHQ